MKFPSSTRPTYYPYLSDALAALLKAGARFRCKNGQVITFSFSKHKDRKWFSLWTVYGVVEFSWRPARRPHEVRHYVVKNGVHLRRLIKRVNG